MTELQSRNEVITATTTSQRIAEKRLTNSSKRVFFSVTNTGGVNLTILKGNGSATAGQGLVLTPNSSYTESSSEGFPCWQDEIQAVSTANCTLVITETLMYGD